MQAPDTGPQFERLFVDEAISSFFSSHAARRRRDGQHGRNVAHLDRLISVFFPFRDGCIGAFSPQGT